MAKLKLSVAVGPYDRTRALIDGVVQIDGVDPVCMTLSPEEIFFRALRHEEFDICELSLSSFTVKTSTGGGPYVGVPAFVSRAFRHNSMWVRTDRIRKPEDLKGKRFGLPEYQLTANVYARGILEDDFGVKPSDVTWVRGGITDADRPEKIALNLPKDIRIEDAPPGQSISAMLAEGTIDAFMAPRAPALPRNTPHVGYLFPDPIAAAQDNFRRTGVFPIMHLVGIRRTLVDAHPWLPAAVFKAFQQSKDIGLAYLQDASASKVTLPFMEERLAETRAFMGEDFWAYGIEGSRKTLDAFLRMHHAQGLSPRLVKAEELFHPSTHEQFKI